MSSRRVILLLGLLVASQVTTLALVVTTSARADRLSRAYRDCVQPSGTCYQAERARQAKVVSDALARIAENQQAATDRLTARIDELAAQDQDLAHRLSHGLGIPAVRPTPRPTPSPPSTRPSGSSSPPSTPAPPPTGNTVSKPVSSPCLDLIVVRLGC